jgi:hypothetical protein
MAGAVLPWAPLFNFGGSEPVFRISEICGLGCIPACIGDENPEPGNEVKLPALWGSHVPEAVF